MTTSALSGRLGHLPLLARFGVTCLLAVLALGLGASLLHMRAHHANRDGEAGLSKVDIEAAYHGIDQPSQLVRTLKGGHPDDLGSQDRALLLDWLDGGRVSEDYDSLELGDLAPAEVLDAACLRCHSRAASEPVDPMLEYWDEVEELAFARQLEALPPEVLFASLHTHALALGSLSLLLGLLTLASRFGPNLRSLPLALGGLGLLLDFTGWWLARDQGAWVAAILIGGGLFALSTTLSFLIILAEMWLPTDRE